MRRKHQVHHNKKAGGEANLEKLIKKVSGIPNYQTSLHEFDEVTLYREDGKIETAEKPKAQINPGKNSFVTLKVEELKEADEKVMMQRALEMLSKQQTSKKETKDEDDDVPELVNTDFEKVEEEKVKEEKESHDNVD